ncbi:hypothetical protein Tco_0153850 [Tanacetum coccineum]
MCDSRESTVPGNELTVIEHLTNNVPEHLKMEMEIPMDLFSFIRHANPTKGRVIPLPNEDDHGYQNENTNSLNEEGGNAEQENRFEEDDRVGQDDNIVVDDDRLREDHDTSGSVGARTRGKATVPFITSSVTPTLERKGGRNTDSIYRPNLHTQHLFERFLISSDFSHHSSTNSADAEVASLVRSSVLLLPVMTAVVATTAVADIFFTSVLGSVLDDHDVCHSVVNQLAPHGLFSQLRGMDYDQLFAKFNVRAARQTCLAAEVRMRFEHNLRERKRFERKCVRQADLLKEKDDEIADLKAQLSLKEAEVAEAIHLCTLDEEKNTLEGQVVALESAAATKDTELASLNAQTAKLTQDLSILQLSCDELNTKSVSLKSERDDLADQVSSLEATCFRLHDQVSGYELFKEHCEAIQNAQVKDLSDRVAGSDFKLMDLALHLDEEFYPRFLTTIAGQRWIISRGFRLDVMKCLQSPKYIAALGMAIDLDIDKGMQTGLVAGIDHGKAERGLAKDASIDDIMDSLCLEDPSAKIPEVSQLQPAYEQLLLPIHRKEDNAVIGETSLSDSLNVVHDHVQKVKEGALSHRLSLSEAIGPLVDPLSSENLVGEASTAEYQQPPPPPLLSPLQSPMLMLRTFQVRGRSFPLRSLSLYAPLPSASVTSYGPSHLGHNFPPSSAWLTSLLQYTRPPSLKLVLQTLLSFKASSFCTMSTSVVRRVGMPILAGITASVLRAFTPSPKLLFALSTKPLAYGCLTEAKR